LKSHSNVELREMKE